MAWKKKLVYIVTAYYPGYDDFGDYREYDEFFADSLDEAEKLKLELLELFEYEDVWVSDFLEEREILV